LSQRWQWSGADAYQPGSSAKAGRGMAYGYSSADPSSPAEEGGGEGHERDHPRDVELR
jgi:hypothetical protein